MSPREVRFCILPASALRCMDETGMNDPEPLPDPPNCIKCGGKMWFSCTEMEKPGFVHHVYECKTCRSTQSFVTAI